jgi:ABC-type Fe3+-hydroxamate transport system substrate-binding protein
MLLTWDEYKEWETDPSEIARILDRHDQAQKKLDAMVNFEEKF